MGSGKALPRTLLPPRVVTRGGMCVTAGNEHELLVVGAAGATNGGQCLELNQPSSW